MTLGSIKKTGIWLQLAKKARREHDREHSGSINKSQRGYHSNLKGSWKVHCRINEKKRQHGKLSYAQIKGSRKFGSMMDNWKGITSFDKSVSEFKTLIKSVPVFVCVVCNLFHYHKSVIF